MPAPSKPAPSPPETPLSPLIRDRILETGPLSIAAFMDMALNHPEYGYYQHREPFGVSGDFITAPETSQIFGELIGLWMATAWIEKGKPSAFNLVELGPGRGQLMADLLRATSKVPGFLDASTLHLVETSKRLIEQQQTALAGFDITWHEQLKTVPSGPLFLIANEVFDALPIHQLQRTEGGWIERFVNVDDSGHFLMMAGDAQSDLQPRLGQGVETPIGEIAEISPARETLASEIGARIQRDGGVALIIDYGAWVDRATGDTLQAVRDHRPVDPLSAPGRTDLTSQIDFRRLGEAAADDGCDVFGPVPQGSFLRTLGIEVRTAALLAKANDDQRRDLRHALFRLTDASTMGEAFKVMVLNQPGAAPPPGFGAASLEGGHPSS